MAKPILRESLNSFLALQLINYLKKKLTHIDTR